MKKTVLLLLTLCLSVAAHADFVAVEHAREKAASFMNEHSKSRKQIKASALRSVNTSARKSPALLSSTQCQAQSPFKFIVQENFEIPINFNPKS